MSLREKIEKLGWRVRYVPHEVIEDYNACYRVNYKGKIIYPPATDKLGIPLNEIWLSEKLREYEEYVLLHELREIHYRYQGYDTNEAHIRARIDEALRFCSDSKWEEYFKKFPDYTIPFDCLRELCGATEKGIKAFNVLYKLLTNCIQKYKHSS